MIQPSLRDAENQRPFVIQSLKELPKLNRRYATKIILRAYFAGFEKPV
jgi:hypothetical protein